jgi:hypothetical protein
MKGHGFLSQSSRSSFALVRMAIGDAPNDPGVVSRYTDKKTGKVYHGLGFGIQAQKKSVEASHGQMVCAHIDAEMTC